MRPHGNEWQMTCKNMQINEDKGEGPGVSSRHEILSSSGWRTVPRKLSHPPPRDSPSPLWLRDPGPKSVLTSLLPLPASTEVPVAHRSPRAWYSRLLPLPWHSILHASWTLKLEYGTGVGHKGSGQGGMVYVLWHFLTSRFLLFCHPHPHMFSFLFLITSTNSLFLLHLLACWVWPLSSDIASWPLWYSPFQFTQPQLLKSQREELSGWQRSLVVGLNHLW